MYEKKLLVNNLKLQTIMEFNVLKENIIIIIIILYCTKNKLISYFHIILK